MNKLLITIAILFAYSGLFSQTWNTGTGAWISPLSKNIGIQKSLQVGDNVGTDSLWCKTDLNYFEGNVGIGTTTPEAKLHVSISDTTGIEIAHLENNIDNAVITVHTHSDSSALYGLQTEDFNSALGLSGTTGEVILLTGLGVEAITIDTTGSVTIPDLAGSGTRVVKTSATGTISASAILESGFYTPTLTILENLDAVSANLPFYYVRNDSIVTVSGSVTFNATSGNLPIGFYITLPFPSNFNNPTFDNFYVQGTGSHLFDVTLPTNNPVSSIYVYSDNTDRAIVTTTVQLTQTNNSYCNLTFTYIIL